MDWQSLRLSLWLAVATGLVLVPTGVLVGRWLARSTHPLKPIAEATLALPLILPPTVLGYYLLVALGGQSPVGQLYARLVGHPLAFSFAGLLVASVIFNIPFAVDPDPARVRGHPRGSLRRGALVRLCRAGERSGGSSCRSPGAAS